MSERLHREQKGGEGKLSSAEQVRLLQSEEYKADLDALRARLDELQKDKSGSVPAWRKVEAPAGEVKPVPFPEISHGGKAGKDVDPNFHRSTAELFKANEFIEEIRVFCRKYGLTAPYFTTAAQALNHIESEKQKILGISRQAEGKR